jgi:hypothetical protein
MKTIRMVSILAMGFSGWMAQALPTHLEPVLVKDLQQTANLMPPIQPGEKRVHSVFTLEVESHGCTKASDFEIDVHQTKSGQFVEFTRVNPDPCDALPTRKSIDLESDDMRLASHSPITVHNPVYAKESVVH